MPKGVKKSDADKTRDAVCQMKSILRRAEKDLEWRTECERVEKVQKDYLEGELKGIKKLQERQRVRRIRVSLGGSDYSGTKYASQVAESLKYRSVPRSSCPYLARYKKRLKDGEFSSSNSTRVQRELKQLNVLMENPAELFTRADWSYVYKRWKKVYARLNWPSARFVVMGAVPGRIPKNKMREIKLREDVDNLKQFMNKELCDVKQ